MIGAILNYFGFVPFFLPLTDEFTIDKANEIEGVYVFLLSHKTYSKLRGQLLPIKDFWRVTYTNGKVAIPVKSIDININNTKINTENGVFILSVRSPDIFNNKVIEYIQSQGIEVNVTKNT